MGNLLQGFINMGVTLATSVVLLMAVISVINSLSRTGGRLTVTVIGSMVLAAIVIWGVVNFVFLSRLTQDEAEDLKDTENAPVLEPDLQPSP